MSTKESINYSELFLVNQDVVKPILQGLRTSVSRTILFFEGTAILGKSSSLFLLLAEPYPPALPLDLTVAHKGQRYKLKLTQITKIYHCKLNQIHYE